MAASPPAVPTLSRTLRSRHVALISIGGIIGAGLFVGSSANIATVGPAVLVSYLVAGVLMFLVMRMLAEMAAGDPNAMSFADHARLGLGPWAGFVCGWLYWYFWVVVVGIEAIAGAVILRTWIPLPVWQIGLGLMVLLTATNLLSTRSYGEFEFWFASIKVAAIIAFVVVVGSYALGLGSPTGPTFENLVAHGGFAPFGSAAVLAGVTGIVFSMTGAEIATVVAAESSEPASAIAAMTTGLIVRILLFYVLSILLILCIVPWTQFKSGDSSFAIALERIGIPGAATIMNIVVLTAVLSCLNSGVYVTARVLFAMAAKGDAPRWLTPANSRQVPARAILLGSAFGFLVMALNWIAPEKLFTFLLNSCGALMMFTYLFVAVAHFRFPYSRPELRDEGGAKYIAGGAALAMIAVMVAMAVMPSKQPEMWASLACLGVIVVALYIKRAVSRPA